MKSQLSTARSSGESGESAATLSSAPARNSQESERNSVSSSQLDQKNSWFSKKVTRDLEEQHVEVVKTKVRNSTNFLTTLIFELQCLLF